LSKECEQRLHQVGKPARAGGDDVLIHHLSFQAPLARIFEGGDLRGGLLAALFFEENPVIRFPDHPITLLL